MDTQLLMEPAQRATRAVGDATRRRLLDVGRTHFAHLGYRGTSVQAVLTEAGVSPPVLYHHYGDKAGLSRITQTDPTLPQMAFTVQTEIQRDDQLAARLRSSVFPASVCAMRVLLATTGHLGDGREHR
jgi:AcrR family transcriptional regulator